MGLDKKIRHARDAEMYFYVVQLLQCIEQDEADFKGATEYSSSYF